MYMILFSGFAWGFVLVRVYLGVCLCLVVCLGGCRGVGLSLLQKYQSLKLKHIVS